MFIPHEYPYSPAFWRNFNDMFFTSKANLHERQNLERSLEPDMKMDRLAIKDDPDWNILFRTMVSGEWPP